MSEFIIGFLIFFPLGVLFAIYPTQFGVAFCKLGKAIWHHTTFGLTDMAIFYPEDKAPKIFRRIGIMFALLSLPLGFIGYLSISGPNSFAAMNDAKVYLKKTYGETWSYNLSENRFTMNADDCHIAYRYGSHQGTLLATWMGSKYHISEEKKIDADTDQGRGSAVK